VGSHPELGKEVYQLRSVHAVGVNSRTGIEDSPVSSLICDRWQQLNLEVLSRCLHQTVDTDAQIT